jgi:metallo-beta-lactamase class B
VAHLTPGHTKGCTSFTTEAGSKAAIYQVMFLCSTSTLDYDLVSNKKYRKIAQDFERTFDKLRSMKVDVFLSSHASFFKMKKKLEMLKENKAANPFVDPQGYRDFIARKESEFSSKLNKQKSAPAK